MGREFVRFSTKLSENFNLSEGLDTESAGVTSANFYGPTSSHGDIVNSFESLNAIASNNTKYTIINIVSEGSSVTTDPTAPSDLSVRTLSVASTNEGSNMGIQITEEIPPGEWLIHLRCHENGGGGSDEDIFFNYYKKWIVPDGTKLWFRITHSTFHYAFNPSRPSYTDTAQWTQIASFPENSGVFRIPGELWAIFAGYHDPSDMGVVVGHATEILGTAGGGGT